MSEPPGSYEICLVCFWEDDSSQLRWPTLANGANRVPLVEAQRNYQAYGACDEQGRQFVREPHRDEPIQPGWRPIDLTRDSFEDWNSEERAPWPTPTTALYWWAEDFWRADQAHGKPAS